MRDFRHLGWGCVFESKNQLFEDLFLPWSKNLQIGIALCLEIKTLLVGFRFKGAKCKIFFKIFGGFFVL